MAFLASTRRSPMGATAAAHPTDQTLQAYGLGKLEDASAESVSKHLEDCPSCQSRVAELSSDDFLGRLRNAQGSPEMPAANRSQVGGSNTDRGPAVAIAPPPADTLPPGLADHPDYEVDPRAGARRDGGGLPRPEQAHGASGGAQGRRRAPGRAPRRARPVPPRGPVGRQAATQEYRHRLFGHPARREPRPGDGVRRGARPGEDGQVRAAAAGGPRLLLHPPGGARLAACPRARHGPPRHQAGQPDPRSRGEEDASSRCSTSAWPR